MQNKALKTLMLSTGIATLAACAPESMGQFYSEAGSVIDSGYFGNSTMNNELIQTGQRDYAVNLAHRFDSEVIPVVNFEFNSTVLDGEAQTILNEQARWIQQFPEVKFRVFGHTDLVGSNAYNRNLGLRRARAVVNYLVQRGVDRRRLEAVSSLGETQPLIQTQHRERRNRRSVTQVSGFVQNHPLVLNGKYAEVIWREYVGSATEDSTVTTTDTADIAG